MTSYIDQIDARLAHLRMEVERLQIARDVIAGLEGKPPKVLQLKANTDPSKKSGPFTIRKIEDGPEPKKRAPVKIDKERGRRALAKIKALLEENPEGLTTSDINNKLGHSGKREYQLVWNIMSDGKKDGTFIKDEATRIFRLPVQDAAE